MPPSSTKYQLKFGPTRVVRSLYLSRWQLGGGGGGGGGRMAAAPDGILGKKTGYRARGRERERESRLPSSAAFSAVELHLPSATSSADADL